jgi:hypothetical protein
VQTAVDRLGHETAQRLTIVLGDAGACPVRELARHRGGCLAEGARLRANSAVSAPVHFRTGPDREPADAAAGLPRRQRSWKVPAVVPRIGYAACALSVVTGFVVMLGLGVPTFEDGSVALGLIVISLSGVAIGLGVAGLVLLARKSGRPG